MIDAGSDRALSTLTEAVVAAAIGPLDGYAGQCHGASLALVRSGVLPGTGWRVGRGACTRVMAQHSWAVQGDPYADGAPIVDVTAWSYDPARPRVWVTTNLTDHRPHGHGSIWQSGRPSPGGEPPISLAVPLSRAAEMFVELAFPDGADRRGWAHLAHSPVGGWPAREIIEAMLATPGMESLVPVDVVGMLTDNNPGGLYR